MERAVGLTSQVCELAVQAGKRIMDIYHNGAAVTLKEDASPLTAADQASHEFLVNSLQLLLPDASIVSEESEEATNSALEMRPCFG